MTHPLTPREKVAEIVRNGMNRLAASQAGARPVVSASKEADRVADAILAALAPGSGDHAELARLADMSACVIARHGRAPSLNDLPVDPENWSGFAHAKILSEHRAALLAENAALRAQSDFYKSDNDVLMKNAWVSRATEAERALSEHRITADLLVSTIKADKAEAERKLAEAAGLKHLTDDQIFAAINAAVTITRDRNGVDNGAVCISPEKFRTFLNKEAERG